jgi:hypothetical protein
MAASVTRKIVPFVLAANAELMDDVKSPRTRVPLLGGLGHQADGHRTEGRLIQRIGGDRYPKECQGASCLRAARHGLGPIYSA